MTIPSTAVAWVDHVNAYKAGELDYAGLLTRFRSTIVYVELAQPRNTLDARHTESGVWALLYTAREWLREQAGSCESTALLGSDLLDNILPNLPAATGALIDYGQGHVVALHSPTAACLHTHENGSSA